MKKRLLFLMALLMGGQAFAQTTIIPYGANWKYLDNGSNQGTTWRNAGFADASWKSGAAQLGYGDGDEATVVGYGSNANAKYITTYFRSTFNVASASAFANYTINARRDDGIVVYINGAEVFRNNMPTGTIAYTTLSSTNCSDDGNGIETTTITAAASAIVSGTNTIAVEIHQTAATSSDISFDLQLQGIPVTAPVTIPRPDHVVVVMMENHSYAEIIGNSAAPFINSLATGSTSASFTQSFGLTHPSQPNYIMLFSGANQGVTTDNAPTFPFTTVNLGAQLVSKGFTFTGYSEDLPSVGYTGTSSGNYVRRHAPWVYWQSASSNGLATTTNQPFTAFPTNYASLPTLSFVIPNLQHDIHDGTIAQGDTWVKTNLSAYVTWAATHNSLLILTFDEDDSSEGNQITTLFVGPMVKKGQYANTINHYNILRTLEDMYGLTYAGNAASATPITNCWTTSPRLAELSSDIQSDVASVVIAPNPVNSTSSAIVNIIQEDQVEIAILDVLGTKTAQVYNGDLTSGKHSFDFNTDHLAAGVYVLTVKGSKNNSYVTFIKK